MFRRVFNAVFKFFEVFLYLEFVLIRDNLCLPILLASPHISLLEKLLSFLFPYLFLDLKGSLGVEEVKLVELHSFKLFN